MKEYLQTLVQVFQTHITLFKPQFQSSGSNLNMSDVVKIAIKEPTIVALHSGRARHDHFLLILHDSDPGTTLYGTPRASNPAMVYHHEEGQHLLQKKATSKAEYTNTQQDLPVG